MRKWFQLEAKFLAEEIDRMTFERFWCQIAIAALLNRARQMYEGEHGKGSVTDFIEYISYDWWDED